MSESRRTYRVPKRIAERASLALVQSRESGMGLSDVPAVSVAQALAANLPVSLDVPRAITEFFSPGWRYDVTKVEKVALHGGDMGRLWAKRCTTSAMTAAGEEPQPLAPPPDEDEADLDEPDEELDESEFQRLLDYYAQFPGGSLPGGTEEPYPTEEPAPPVEVQESEVQVETATDAAEDVVDTALGLVTALDETVERLSDALVDMAEGDEDDFGALVEPMSEEEQAEARMVYAALADVIRGENPRLTDELATEAAALKARMHKAQEPAADELVLAAAAIKDRMRRAPQMLAADELAAAAAAVKERMSVVALQRKRSLAMSRMASARLQLSTTLADSQTGGGGNPKASKHHAEDQPRTNEGRFTGIGTPVRDKQGRRGFIAGQIGTRTVIKGEDGEVRVMQPDEFDVAHKGKGVIRQEPQPVEDPQQMMSDYLAEMQRRMGVTPE